LGQANKRSKMPDHQSQSDMKPDNALSPVAVHERVVVPDEVQHERQEQQDRDQVGADRVERCKARKENGTGWSTDFGTPARTIGSSDRQRVECRNPTRKQGRIEQDTPASLELAGDRIEYETAKGQAIGSSDSSRKM
jgi:hypothetical protein